MMKKILPIVTILLIAVFAGWFYFGKNPVPPEQKVTEDHPAGKPTPPVSSPAFDTSDHLDQSLDDLNAVNNL